MYMNWPKARTKYNISPVILEKSTWNSFLWYNQSNSNSVLTSGFDGVWYLILTSMKILNWKCLLKINVYLLFCYFQLSRCWNFNISTLSQYHNGLNLNTYVAWSREAIVFIMYDRVSIVWSILVYMNGHICKSILYFFKSIEQIND